MKATALTPADRQRRWIQGGLDLRQAGFQLAWDARDPYGIVCLSLLRLCLSCQQSPLSPVLCPTFIGKLDHRSALISTRTEV